MNDWTVPIHIAVYSSDYDEVLRLLYNEADVNERVRISIILNLLPTVMSQALI